MRPGVVVGSRSFGIRDAREYSRLHVIDLEVSSTTSNPVIEVKSQIGSRMMFTLPFTVGEATRQPSQTSALHKLHAVNHKNGYVTDHKKTLTQASTHPSGSQPLGFNGPRAQGGCLSRPVSTLSDYNTAQAPPKFQVSFLLFFFIKKYHGAATTITRPPTVMSCLTSIRRLHFVFCGDIFLPSLISEHFR